ncbi:hypothetical protein CPA57_01785 [Bombella sp. TMW2.1880]|uniref:Uncharacterized protein n=1 Tax=Bombella favorum TaxID=2039164 RepID=A0ABR5ZL89_9PROT|nr:hypothetical protein [Bombella favorum]
MLNSHSQKSRLQFFCRPVMGRQDPDGAPDGNDLRMAQHGETSRPKTASISGCTAFWREYVIREMVMCVSLGKWFGAGNV